MQKWTLITPYRENIWKWVNNIPRNIKILRHLFRTFYKEGKKLGIFDFFESPHFIKQNERIRFHLIIFEQFWYSRTLLKKSKIDCSQKCSRILKLLKNFQVTFQTKNVFKSLINLIQGFLLPNNWGFFIFRREKLAQYC